MIRPGASLTLDIEKPAAGGRMMARHGGQVVLVFGAIPGEQVVARVERVHKKVIFAEVSEVVSASPDRRAGTVDWRCGGSVLGHIAYARQVLLKGEIIKDAFGRIGRMPLAGPVDVVASREDGYRMRARLHVRGHRIGFYREGSHELCPASAGDQLRADTLEWIAGAERHLRDERVDGLVAIDLSESLDGRIRVCHLEIEGGRDVTRFAPLREGLSGLTATAVSGRPEGRPLQAELQVLHGSPYIADTLDVGGGARVTLRRDVRAFFQGNRYLVERLAQYVLDRTLGGPLIDLYAGVGLFGLGAAARGATDVRLVEGDPVSGEDLAYNADALAAAGRAARVDRQSVEAVVSGLKPGDGATVVVDPPRTGMSKEALAGIIRLRPERIVYVSCDVATLARDARVLVDAGFTLDEVRGMDLFPNTAHVETIATFSRDERGVRVGPS